MQKYKNTLTFYFFKKKNWQLFKVLKIFSKKHIKNLPETLLSQYLSFFLSISRFIQKHLVSGVEWQRKWHKHKNRYRFNRIFLVFLFCFVSIVLMYEWLNMKIKRNIDQFLGFWRRTIIIFFEDLPINYRIYRETLGFTEKR